MLSYNSSRLGGVFRDCVDSLLATDYPSFELMIVDNGSSDDSAEQAVRSRNSARLKLLKLGKNRGYAGGNDAAVFEGGSETGDLLVFVNSDVLVKPGWLKPLVSAMARDRVGACGPVHVDRLSGRVDIAGNFCTLGGVTVALKTVPNDTELYSVNHVHGACLATRTSAFAALGGFNPKFFSYFEEVDYCSRLRSLGFEVCVAPASSIVHHGASTFRANRLTLTRSFYLSRNLFYYFYQNRPPMQLVASVFLALMNRARRVVGLAVRGDAANCNAVIKGTIAGLFGMKRGGAAYGRRPLRGEDDDTLLPPIVDFLSLAYEGFGAQKIQSIIIKKAKPLVVVAATGAGDSDGRAEAEEDRKKTAAASKDECS